MHHVIVEQWTRRTSPLHALDPRSKLLATLAFLVAVATADVPTVTEFAAYGALLGIAVFVGRLPAPGVGVRACVVLPFSGAFALFSVLAGDADRAVLILVKSYLSAFAALLLVGTTPLPRLLYGLERLGSPRIFVLVVQFLYRYLFLISEQGQHMRQAAVCRGGLGRAPRRVRLRAATGAVAVLFARSYRRAESVYRAMLARGFQGRLELVSPLAFRARDAGFVVGAAVALLAIRLRAWSAW